jgi:hypothetical protein
MTVNFLRAAVLAAVIAMPTAALAGAKDYVFEAVQAQLPKGDDVTVAVRLVHKPSGKPVSDVVFVRTRIDMSPDKMGDMVSPIQPVAAKEPGAYAFKTELPMAGRYLFSIAAKVQGEPETVVGKLILTATK